MIRAVYLTLAVSIALALWLNVMAAVDAWQSSGFDVYLFSRGAGVR